MRRRAVAEHVGDDPQPVFETPEPLIERDAVARELRLVPARADTQDDPPAAHLVERLGHLGEQRRMAERDGEDIGAERHATGRRGQRRQQRPRLPGTAPFPARIPEPHMVRDPDGIEPDRLRRLRHLQDVGPARRPTVHRAFDVGQVEPQSERATLQFVRAY
jgi:hypothetical protein